ncbi:retrovirus-related pol polyprotein from transposon TNT 1-94 [Tanacetum coccineum]
MFRINHFKTSREEKHVPNKPTKASVKTKSINVSQPHIITKKDVNSDSNGLSSIGIDNTAKTNSPQPRSNTKNDRIPSASKSSCIKNKEVELAIRNDKSEVVCAMCKQCLFTINHDVCVLNYVSDMNSRGKKQKANVSYTENQKKQKPEVKKPKKVGFKERLASPSPSEPSISRTVCFGNDHVVAILDLEVAFKRNTCFVRNLEGVYLLKGNRTTNLYTINLHDMASASPICLMARATSTKSWLWHQRLSHLNFDTINDLAKNDLVTGLLKFKYHKEHLCPPCEQGKSKRASYPPKLVLNSKQRLHLLHMDLCGPMRIEHKWKANDREYIGKLGAKAMVFEQSSLKPRLQSITSGQISSGLDLTYAPSKITNQQPTERELDLLFEAMYDDYIGGQPSAAPRTVPVAQAPQVLQTPTTSITIADTAPTPINSSS